MRTAITVVTLAAIVLVASVYLKLYYVVDHSGATLYSRRDEACVILGASRSGYRFSYLGYPVVLIREYFYAVPPPDRRVASLIALYITPNTVERRQIDFGNTHPPTFLTPFEDGFYAMCPGGVLCKLKGTSFVPATEDEKKTHDLTQLTREDINNKVVNGWYVRQVRGPGDHFEVNIDNKLTLAARNHAIDVREYPKITVDLLRAGQPSESVYNVNGTPRRVSESEYRHYFPN